MTNSESADTFRPIEGIFGEDCRNTSIVVFTPDGPRPKLLADYHRRVAEIVLAPTVSAHVRVQFDTARELYVHAWSNWRFGQIAERHAYAVLEMALLERVSYPKPKLKKNGQPRSPGLSELLNLAIDQQRFNDTKIKHFCPRGLSLPIPSNGKQIQCDVTMHATRFLPNFRNDLAHGSNTFDISGVALQIGLCCDLINQLY